MMYEGGKKKNETEPALCQKEDQYVSYAFTAAATEQATVIS